METSCLVKPASSDNIFPSVLIRSSFVRYSSNFNSIVGRFSIIQSYTPVPYLWRMYENSSVLFSSVLMWEQRTSVYAMRRRHCLRSLQWWRALFCFRSSSINIVEDIGNSENDDDGESGGRAFCSFGVADKVKRKETQNTENPTDMMILLMVRMVEYIRNNNLYIHFSEPIQVRQENSVCSSILSANIYYIWYPQPLNFEKWNQQGKLIFKAILSILKISSRKLYQRDYSEKPLLHWNSKRGKF